MHRKQQHDPDPVFLLETRDNLKCDDMECKI